MSPLVERFSFPKNLTRGKRLRVICTVTEGDLPLEVEWWKDGLKIEEAFGKFGVQVRRIDEYTSLLAISFLETTHAGNYSCVAKNSVASFARYATLTIRGKYSRTSGFLFTFPVECGECLCCCFRLLWRAERDTSGKMIKVIFGKSNRTKIVRRQVYFFQAKLASCTTSPQTQIYAWGIDPKVRFPLFLAILESKRGEWSK